MLAPDSEFCVADSTGSGWRFVWKSENRRYPRLTRSSASYADGSRYGKPRIPFDPEIAEHPTAMVQ